MLFFMLLIVTTIFPLLANNSARALCKSLLPPASRGKQFSWVTIVWMLPGAALAISPLAKYVKMHANGSV